MEARRKLITRLLCLARAASPSCRRTVTARSLIVPSKRSAVSLTRLLDAANKAGYRSLPAPPTYLGTAVFIPGRSSDTFSGPSEGQPTIAHGLPGVLDGGTETEYFEQLCAGDSVSVVTKITGLDVRESKAIGKMLITTTETTYTNQATAKVAAVQRSQVITY